MKKNKGFSLVELIIVIAIMAILVGVIAPQLIRYIEKANISADVTTLDSIRSAVTYAASDPKFATSDNSADVLPVSGAYGSLGAPTLNSIANATVPTTGTFKSKTHKNASVTTTQVTVNDQGQVAVSLGNDFKIDFNGKVTSPDGEGNAQSGD